jgi:hypothetical protein
LSLQAGPCPIQRQRDGRWPQPPERKRRQPELRRPLLGPRRLQFNILNLSAGRHQAARSPASRVRTTQKLIAIAASKAYRRSPIPRRPHGKHRFRVRPRHGPLAVVVAAVATVPIPSRGVNPFIQMIANKTLPLMKPSLLLWLRRILLLASGPGLAFLALTLPVCASAADDQSFVAPQDAVNALVAAAGNHDTNALHTIFGPAGHALISPDVVQATEEYKIFVQRLAEKTQLVTNSDSNVTLEIGADGWPFPIPLVKQDGQWFFDTAAGRQEILSRRIGMDETGAMNVCNAYVEAQREYAGKDRMGDGVLAYAQFLRSTPGAQDGLFWPAKPGEELSPLGPLVAQARVEGYHRTAKMLNDELAPYHGYYFKILTRQGKHAPGGKYDYIINGRMIAGFALVAWPAEWGDTGVMTFIVNQQGEVYQKNLGPKTVKIARTITTYDPDDTWAPAQ